MTNGKQQLYRDLKRRILTLELEPGADLDETQLSQEYGISRTPLRDVFRDLAGEGYLSIESNRGASVSPLSHTTLRDFFLAAPMIYAATARLAARNATEPQIGLSNLTRHHQTGPGSPTGNCRRDAQGGHG